MWSFAIALGVYAFDAAGAAAVGIAGLVRLLPGALAAPFGGLMGDRHSRRAVLLWSTLATMGVLAGAALAVGPGRDLVRCSRSPALYTAVASPYIPAEAALVPQLARTPQELSAANVTHSVMDNLGFLGGRCSPASCWPSARADRLRRRRRPLPMSLLAGDLRPDPRPAYAGEAGVEGAAARSGRLQSPALGPAPAPARRVPDAAGPRRGSRDVLDRDRRLDLLDLPNAVGYLNAAWGIGALLGGGALAVLLRRGQLVAGSSSGA